MAINVKGRNLYISIHAPAQGATGATCFVDIRLLFQSTLPRRERPPSAAALLGIS